MEINCGGGHFEATAHRRSNEQRKEVEIEAKMATLAFAVCFLLSIHVVQHSTSAVVAFARQRKRQAKNYGFLT